MDWLTIYLIVHIVCGVLTYGIAMSNNYTHFIWLLKKSTHREWVLRGMLGVILGPIGLFAEMLANKIALGKAYSGFRYTKPTLSEIVSYVEAKEDESTAELWKKYVLPTLKSERFFKDDLGDIK